MIRAGREGDLDCPAQGLARARVHKLSAVGDVRHIQQPRHAETGYHGLLYSDVKPLNRRYGMYEVEGVNELREMAHPGADGALRGRSSSLAPYGDRKVDVV